MAQYSNIECAVEAPFSPISSESPGRNLQLMREVSIVVLPNLCFGSANLKSLKAAEFLVDKLVIVEETPIASRGFKHGVDNEFRKTYETPAPFSQSSMCS